MGGLGAAFAWTSLSTAQSVVIAERAITRGDTIQPGDFGLADVSAGPGVAFLPGDRLAGLIGQRALTDLPVGSLVGPQSVGSLTVPGDESVVGLRLSLGRAPVGKLVYGTKVTLLQVQKDDSSLAPTWTVEATVVTASTSAGDGSILVDVSLPHADALSAALLSAREELAMTRLGG